MHTCEDLVYKLHVQNNTENWMLYKIAFKEALNEPVNLHWPLNGLKGRLAPFEQTTVAMLPKIRPGEAPSSARLELEKLAVTFSAKLDI